MLKNMVSLKEQLSSKKKPIVNLNNNFIELSQDR